MDIFLIEEKISGLLAAKFQEEDFNDCFLVSTELHKDNKVEVFVDSDSGISLEKCQKISRYLEGYIDGENWFGDNYTLEVSSPDLSRPLKLKRQYKKNIGRTLELTLTNGTVKTAVLRESDEEKIKIEETQTVSDGKKKKQITATLELPYEQIKKTLVVISFK